MWNQNITPWIIVSQLQLSILQLSPVTRKVCNSLKSHILYATFVISNNKQLKGLLLCDKKEHKIYCSKKGENVNDKTIIYIDLFFSISTSRQNLEFDIIIQLVSEKCTGRYFKVRDDKIEVMYIQNDTYQNYSKIFLSTYIFTYFIFVIKLKHNMNIFLRIRYWWDRFCGNLWIDRYFRILSGTRIWRLRYTFLKYPVHQQ